MSQNRFGGERLDSKSSLSKNNLLEHLARYNLVTPNKIGQVLDIGCGSGHGSFVLADKFSNVMGVDVSPEAISYARLNWQKPNIEYKEGSGTKIPYSDNLFDSVVAYEVFEHICDWQKFLAEIKRVLKPNGLVYISTPNKTLYSPGTTKPINPHHCFEMTILEFKKALAGYFSIENFYGQRTPVYNDHWIWGIVNPILWTFKRIIPYKWNNSLKLQIINLIKAELEEGDIVFKTDEAWVNNSRFMLAVCRKTNNQQEVKV